jgi:L-amino acid N-acyltransferase YncA
MSHDEVTIRETRDEDVEAIIDLLHDVAEERLFVGTQAPFDKAARAERFRAALGKLPALVAVEPGGRIAGEASLFEREGRVTLGMLLAASWRGRGLGKALLERMIAEARTAGIRAIELEVFPHNERARRLYERAGFRQTGFLHEVYARNHGEVWSSIVMRLDL